MRLGRGAWAQTRVRPRCAQTAQGAAPVPAPGRRPAAVGRAARLAQPAARRRVAAAARHRDAHRRAARPGTGLRARGAQLRGLVEGSAGQARHRADGAHRRRHPRPGRPDRRAPLARQAGAAPAHRPAGPVPAHPPGTPHLGGHPARRTDPRRHRSRTEIRYTTPTSTHLCHRPDQLRRVAAGADRDARPRLGGDEPALRAALRRNRPRRLRTRPDPRPKPSSDPCCRSAHHCP